MAWAVSESCWVKPWAGDTWLQVRPKDGSSPLAHSPLHLSAFDHTGDVGIHKSITHDDAGLKVVKSLRYSCGKGRVIPHVIPMGK